MERLEARELPIIENSVASPGRVLVPVWRPVPKARPPMYMVSGALSSLCACLDQALLLAPVLSAGPPTKPRPVWEALALGGSGGPEKLRL